MNAPIPPSFIQQADAILERIASLDLTETERRDFDSIAREKHRLLQEEGRYLTKLTAWGDMVEAKVASRKAHEEAMAKNDVYIRTMDELTASITVKVSEYVAVEPAEAPDEEAA